MDITPCHAGVVMGVSNTAGTLAGAPGLCTRAQGVRGSGVLGFSVNRMDIAPRHAGVVMGVSHHRRHARGCAWAGAAAVLGMCNQWVRVLRVSRGPA